MLLIAAVAAVAVQVARPSAPPPPPPPPPPPRSESRSRPARPAQPLQRRVSSQEYPFDALRRGAEGTVTFRLDVDQVGRVSGCAILRASGDASLDSATCRLFALRARFDPARDFAGRPTTGYTVRTIVWRLEDVPAMAFAPTLAVNSVRVSRDRRITCRLQVDDQPAVAADGAGCAEALQIGTALLQSPDSLENEVRIVIAVAPAGLELPAQPGAVGALLGEAEADIFISPPGDIQGCRIVRLEGRARTAPDFCAYLMNGKHRFELADDERPRSGRIRMSAEAMRRPASERSRR